MAFRDLGFPGFLVAAIFPCDMCAPNLVRLHFGSSRPTAREPEEGAPIVAVEVDGEQARRASEPLVAVVRPWPLEWQW